MLDWLPFALESLLPICLDVVLLSWYKVVFHTCSPGHGSICALASLLIIGAHLMSYTLWNLATTHTTKRWQFWFYLYWDSMVLITGHRY
jgi:hypothetical protein